MNTLPEIQNIIKLTQFKKGQRQKLIGKPHKQEQN